MQCREACGACCVAPSIRQPFYGMPGGKPAGQPCVHLDPAMRCTLFGDSRRPALCAGFLPEGGVCGSDRAEALASLGAWERVTLPPYALEGGSR